MADTATNASEKTSKQAETHDDVLVRLETLADQWAEEGRPKPWIYHLRDEEEAAMILLTMAATIKVTAKDVHNKMDKQTYLNVARDYRLAVTQGRALETFREMTKEDQLAIYGIELNAQRIITQ